MQTRSVAASLAAACLLALTTGVLAAPAPDRSPVKAADTASAVRTVAATEGEDDSGSCSRSRKRLWVEGEGWVVRRITTCR
ncbi:hypothetical protein [Methylobacterium trifolii]|uniref:Secreted protein n=1 Tax=Methylobacterium trifolii TaxID=1003092 RepID=A0ABQ4TRS0_9HYPH|nr:hypothetical protein [Methylobacterium trifolii]GJE58049.1 hypothetical protein MPOCJGCO_0126 [Methylobacterium trifolii]